MPKDKPKKLTYDHHLIMKYVLSGLSRNEIAKKMNFSTSNVSHKLNELFVRYNAKNKHEFMLNIFSEIISDKKKELKDKDILIKKIETESKNLKMFINNIIDSIKDKDKLLFWINKTKTYLKR